MQLQEQQKDVEETIPGFRFYPTEDELVSFYLHNMLEERKLQHLNRVIPVINIYELEPWQLPKLSGELCNGDTEQWFFFVPRQEREARGGRPNRTTASGYWKATGSPGYVYSSDNRIIGVKKSLVFYNGKAPTGKKTKWKMNEYRAIKEEMPTSSTHAIPKLRHELSLCRVYIISGSFRAFDRRPIGTGTSRDVVNQATHYHDIGGPEISTKLMERRSSGENSATQKEAFVDDHVDSEGTNWEMQSDLKSLWVLDQSNCMQLPQNKN